MEQRVSSALVAEAYGTFLLTLIGPMSVTIVKNPNIFPAGVPLGIGFIGLAHGAALIVGIATVARISGAHFNPAVTVGLAYSGRFPKNRVIPYVLAQLVGATIAGFVQLAIVGLSAAQASDLGNTAPNQSLPFPVLSALLAEIVGTAILFTTILGSSDSASILPWSGSAIGLSLAAVIWALGGVSGASLNPARTFGPSIASLVFDPTVFTTYWIYAIGPLIGALLAAELYKGMKR